MAQLVGMHFTVKDNVKFTTLHLAEDFNSYFINAEAGRGAFGRKVDTVYVGAYDCSDLKVGMEIDICYDKMISTAKGSYQPIKRIDILTKA